MVPSRMLSKVRSIIIHQVLCTHAKFHPDVDGVIHAASPLPGRVSPEEGLEAAIDGSINVLRQAEKVGIKNFVLVSSTVAVTSGGGNKLTTEDGAFIMDPTIRTVS